ncbi:MAG: hypothetical protein FWH15_02190 [Betaproteobacteria bacterium]|nr:hypothetical protein [Betaproteobacteria bacterium]
MQSSSTPAHSSFPRRRESSLAATLAFPHRNVAPGLFWKPVVAATPYWIPAFAGMTVELLHVRKIGYA